MGSMKSNGVRPGAGAMCVIFGLALVMLGAGAGGFYAVSLKGTPYYHGALSLGIAGCLWLAVEDLLMEAHEKAGEAREKVAVTGVFFLGFLLPIVLGKLINAE